eukprot:3941262-Rhodomonas_salina.2
MQETTFLVRIGTKKSRTRNRSFEFYFGWYCLRDSAVLGAMPGTGLAYGAMRRAALSKRMVQVRRHVIGMRLPVSVEQCMQVLMFVYGATDTGYRMSVYTIVPKPATQAALTYNSNGTEIAYGATALGI